MDKFEKQLNQVKMATPQTKFGFTSSNKPNEPSYASLNEFSKMNTMDIYDNDVVNLRSQIQILEGKLVFYDREFQIKQQSLEKRIQQLIQTCSQLTQQNTQLKLQYQSLMGEYQQIQEQFQFNQKNQYEYEDKVKVQMESVSKFNQEKEQLILYANKCRERSKTRKQKCKDLNNTIQDNIIQNQQLQKEIEQYKQKQEQMYTQYQIEIQEAQDKNEEWQMKYSQLLQNVKNHLTEEDDLSIQSQFQQTQPIQSQSNQLDEKDLQKLQEQLEYYDQFQKDVSHLLNDIQNNNQITNQNYENPQMNQLSQIFNRMVQRIFEVTEKKQKYKQKAQELQQQITQLQSKSQQSPKIPSQQQISSDLDDRTKFLFEQRILELEQYYQKDKQFLHSANQDKQRSMTSPMNNQQTKKMQQIIKMLTQYLYEYITYTENLRELNYQLNELQSEPQRKNQSSMKKYVYVIIAIHRLQKLTQSTSAPYIYYKSLKMEMPIITTLHYFLELVGTQQQLIDTMQKAVEQQNPTRRQSDSNLLQETEIQTMVDSELRQQIRQLQNDMEQNTKRMLDYKNRTDRDLEEKDQIISQLERENNLLKDQLQQDDNSHQLNEQLQEQWHRVKQIESEFIGLNELIEQLQQL